MEIDVLIEEGVETCIPGDEIHTMVEDVLKAAEISSNVELGVVLTTPDNIRTLNKKYLGKDEPTDIISFPLIPVTEGAKPPYFLGAPDGKLHLGEMVICYDQAVKQAGERKHSIEQELTELVIHGVLHLLGHDHHDPEEAALMAAREAAILGRMENAE